MKTKWIYKNERVIANCNNLDEKEILKRIDDHLQEGEELFSFFVKSNQVHYTFEKITDKEYTPEEIEKIAEENGYLSFKVS
jgi:hypothetical protein